MQQWEKDTLRRPDPPAGASFLLRAEGGGGTPLYRQRDSLTLPDDDAQADMYLYAVTVLAQNGYEQYEISNFAKARAPPATI